jgi:hypothetical protein
MTADDRIDPLTSKAYSALTQRLVSIPIFESLGMRVQPLPLRTRQDEDFVMLDPAG